jgi:exopolyphosphatase / guanosine-5'-triphosphate,3'-diphosphate pyrophosphatase
MRVAAIDIGTNSVHLVVADVGPDGAIAVVEKARVQVELGRGGLEHHRITNDAMERAVLALVLFKQTMDLMQVEAISASATSAVREAQNGAEFCDRVNEATGIHVQVISGVDESRLIWLGARPNVDFARGPALLIDIGGGSVELVVCDENRMITAHSLPLGHLRLTDQFVGSDPPTADEIGAIRRQVRGMLKAVSDVGPDVRGILVGPAIGSVVGTSGSIRTLGRMATMMRGHVVAPHDHGLVLTRAELKKLLQQMQELKSSRLDEIPGMDMRRKRTLPTAAAVLYQLMKTFEIEQLSTSEAALREGLLYDWIERHRPELVLSGTGTPPRMRAVLSLMERFCVDEPHAKHVRDLSLSLFDGLVELHGLDADARAMLEYAALLHDIGHHIDARDHNRHGEYLIVNSRMPGFMAPEVAILGLLVRYHRGARPKDNHRSFQVLPAEDQRRVEVSSAILRLADALDRSHHQPVHSVRVIVQEDRVIVEPIARDEAYLERWAAERRIDSLSQALGRPVRLALVPGATAVGFDPVDRIR